MALYRSLLKPILPDMPRNGDSYPIALCFDAAKAERQKIESYYDEAIGFSMPGRQGFSLGPNSSSVYDDTAIIAAPEFASNIQAGIMPNFSRWASHMAGVLIEDEETRVVVRGQLEQVDSYIFDMINSSNATSEIHESLLDLAVGTGCLRADKGPGLHPLNVRAVPQRALYFTTGSDGQPDAIFEERELSASAWDVDYPNIVLPPNLPAPGAVGSPPQATQLPPKIKGVESWQRDWTEPTANKWICRVFFPNHNNHVGLEYEKRGSGCCPYVGPFRWSKGSGEAWGRGPLFNVLPSMRTVNFAMMAVLDHADMALAGIWNVEDDGVVNTDTVRLEPGALIPKAPGSSGITNVRSDANFDIQQFMLDYMRKNIKAALFVDELGDPNKSPKTATEVQQRMANLARRIGSPFGRLIIELVFPFIRRVTYVLKEQGLIRLPVVDGREINLVPTSPLAEAQRFDDIDGVDRFLALIARYFGTEALNLVVDVGETSDYLAERFPVATRILRKKDQREQLVTKLTEGIAAGGGQSAGFGGEVIPQRNPGPATG